MAHAQHVARAMLEVGALRAFVTTYAYRSDGLSAALLKRMPSRIGRPIARQLERRAVAELPAQYVHCFPLGEMLRSAAQKAGAGPIVVDRLFDYSSRSFDAFVAKRYVACADAVQCFEFTALESFRRAGELGVAKILHIPSLDSAHYREIERRERGRWTALSSASDDYFERIFGRRYERRLKEIALADVIVANSRLTANSHIAAGADPAKVIVAVLGAPPAIADVEFAPDRGRKPLNVLYAGSFSLGKGAHYLLQAWQRLDAGAGAVLNVYGRMTLPKAAIAGRGESVVFHGSVPQPVLFRAYEAADVLVFPTLADGFGSVVAEALAHGLPVITTDQAGAAELVTPECGFVVPAGDADALTEALRWCLDNRKQVQAMRFAALEAARRRQWSDFRRDLIDGLDAGICRSGYNPCLTREWPASQRKFETDLS